jgi:MFS family permease
VLGSYALVGVLVGALLAGTLSDVLGRRTLMLLAYGWFSVGMAVTALMTTASGFGLLRFVTGLGVGALVATTGAIVSEFAPPGKKNLCNAIVYSGVPFGSLLSALLAILLLGSRPAGQRACPQWALIVVRVVAGRLHGPPAGGGLLRTRGQREAGGPMTAPGYR